jgi:hypothetical protein
MARSFVKLSVALIVLHLAYAHSLGTTVVEAQASEIQLGAATDDPGKRSASARAADSPGRQDIRPTDAQTSAIASSDPILSTQAEQVSHVAMQNGDKVFLLVDKVRGEIFLFENGKPVISGTALTGAGIGDRIPPKVLAIPSSRPLTSEQKVTPAGRFTVTQEADKEYGRVLTLNEVHGVDWDIAIHQVYLGTRSEHRDVRLRSSNVGDRHITYGCINVDRSTILLLTRALPRKGKIPLYILPQDEDMTAVFFPLRDPPPAPQTPTN